MKILKVSENRYLREYSNFIRDDGSNIVNWFVDEHNVLNLYIFTVAGIGFLYSTPVSDVSEGVKSTIRAAGSFHGFVEEKQVSEVVNSVLQTQTL